MRRRSWVPSGSSTTSEKTIIPRPGSERTSLYGQPGSNREDHLDGLVLGAVAPIALEPRG
jgi:hypothetical protein